jgi:Ca-activated chloride channel homolog
VSFLQPWAFLLFGLSVPLLLLYFLKVRRQQRRVSSIMFWTPVFRDQQASALFQRLQLDPLLLLQLLALLLLVGALARPSVTLQGQGAERLILVMDTSTSMKARDVSPSRFREAQFRAAALISEAGRGAEVMAAVYQLEARDQPNHLSEAIRTALALVPAVDPRVRVHVLTDGAFDPGQVREFPDPRVRWVSVGAGARNVGITQFAVRKSYYAAFDYQAFLSVTNFSDERLSFPLVLTVDDRRISEQTITLDPNVKRNVVVPFTLQGAGVVRASVEARDDLDADNVVHAVIPEPRKLRVLLVSGGNLFLEKALRTDPQVVLETRTPGEYQGSTRSCSTARRPSASGRAGSCSSTRLPGTCRSSRWARWRIRSCSTGCATTRSCGSSTCRRWRSRRRSGSGPWRPGRRSSSPWAVRSCSSWRSRSGRPCSSASTSSRPTSRSGWRSR